MAISPLLQRQLDVQNESMLNVLQNAIDQVKNVGTNVAGIINQVNQALAATVTYDDSETGQSVTVPVITDANRACANAWLPVGNSWVNLQEYLNARKAADLSRLPVLLDACRFPPE